MNVTVDIVLFRRTRLQAQEVLLIRRKNDPFRGKWALPGGFVDEDETLEAAALRELEEETGLNNIVLKQLYTFGEPGRDPRGRTVSVAYTGYATESAAAKASDDASEAAWFSIHDLPDLAFDHKIILNKALLSASAER